MVSSTRLYIGYEHAFMLFGHVCLGITVPSGYCCYISKLNRDVYVLG
jgi:hypothetical protein